MDEQRDTIAVDDAALQHLHSFMAGMRGQRPVCPVTAPRRPHAWLVTRYSEVRALLTDDRMRHDLTAKGADLTDRQALIHRFVYSSMLYRDPPDHTRLRRLTNRTFTVPSVARLRPLLVARIEDILDEFDPSQPIDVVTQFGVPLTVFAICELLGIPEGEERERFWAWSQHLNGGELADEYYRALEGTSAYLAELLTRKRARPGDDLLSELIAVSEQDDERLSADELVATALLLLMAGHDTTVNLIANTTLSLLTAPDQLTLLNLDHELVPNAIEEVLRYESPVNILPPRLAAEPITVDGVTIPAGDTVLLSVASANRDDTEFPDPDTFDITRKPGRQLAFGHGIHYCPGAPLARLEARLAIGGLLGRFPNLRLVSNPEELRWRDSTLMHGPAELLIRVD
ncbi:MAG TPA: cytochrome P450 [Pseudonocardiaceae bacterium]|nr:cytochrome P450 [Pseudonocardiaceae bacterium]